MTSDGRGQTREERQAKWTAQHAVAQMGGFSRDEFVAAAMALADVEQADLRARLASCEANLEQCGRILAAATAAAREWERRANEYEGLWAARSGDASNQSNRALKAEAELVRLRDGIQALADETHWRPASWWREGLRALVSTPDTEETPNA